MNEESFRIVEPYMALYFCGNEYLAVLAQSLSETLNRAPYCLAQTMLKLPEKLLPSYGRSTIQLTRLA